MLDRIKRQTLAFMRENPDHYDFCWQSIHRIAEPILGDYRWDVLWLDGREVIEARRRDGDKDEEIGGALWCQFFFESFPARATPTQLSQFIKEFQETPFFKEVLGHDGSVSGTFSHDLMGNSRAEHGDEADH